MKKRFILLHITIIIFFLGNINLSIAIVDTFTAESNDGTLVYTETPFSCTSAISGATTISTGDIHLLIPATQQFALMEFNTSSIPDDATISSVVLKVRVQSYMKRKTDSFTWNLQILSQKSEYGTLDCSDLISGLDTTYNLGGTTGLKSITVDSSKVNITGFTTYQLNPNGWLHAPASNQRTVNFRSTEYGSTPPQLIITYTIPSPTPTNIELLNITPNITQYPFISLGENNTKLIIVKSDNNYPIVQLNKTLNMTILPNILQYPKLKINEVTKL